MVRRLDAVVGQVKGHIQIGIKHDELFGEQGFAFVLADFFGNGSLHVRAVVMGGADDVFQVSEFFD